MRLLFIDHHMTYIQVSVKAGLTVTCYNKINNNVMGVGVNVYMM